MKLENVKVGQIVKLKKNAGKHTNINEFVEIGTLGEVIKVDLTDNTVEVKWESSKDIYTQWWCDHKEIKLIKDVE